VGLSKLKAIIRRSVMRKICVEAHFDMKDYMDYLFSRKEIPRREFVDDGQSMRDWMTPDLSLTQPVDAGFTSNLGDLDNVKHRLKDMDEAGIDMQVLSMAHPSFQDIEPADAVTWARKLNDKLAQVIKKYPDRFAGLARIPFQDPVAAVKEVERAVKELGLHGIKTDSHVRGEYLDDKKYWPIFAKAEELDVPMYLHPREPSPDMIKPYLAYPGLPGSMWGYGAETGLHAVRLMCSGLFDEYPRLKIILGHMGEALPFWQWRLDQMGPTRLNNVKKKLSEYVANNFFVSTSGNFSNPALICALLAMGADKILFAVDYVGHGTSTNPNLEAVQFMEAAPVSTSDKEKIYHLNAEKLLKL
jgi:2,3-dihydroxybenzoate decarboxylase